MMNAELRILMLEDSPTDAKLVELALRKAEISFVAECVDTREGFLKSLDSFKPDIVLADYKLPSFDGLAAVNIVQQTHPEVPVIMVSGALGDEGAVELLRAGAKDYVLKDRLARLGPAVERALSEEMVARARRAAEKALRESEELFRSISLTAQDAILMIGPDERISFWNAAAEKIFGYGADEAMNKPMHALLAPSRYSLDVQRGFAHFHETGEGPIIGKTLEVAALRRDGTEFPIELSLSALQQRGRWHGLGIVRDVTERKQAERTIRESEQKYRAIYEGVKDVIFLLDSNGHFLSISQAVEPITGFTATEWIGHSFVSLVHPDDLPRAQDTFQRILAGEVFNNFESRILKKSGDYFDAETSLSSIVYDDSLQVLGVARDVSERKQVQQKLQKANRALHTIGNCNELLIHATDESHLLNDMCRIIVDTA